MIVGRIKSLQKWVIDTWFSFSVFIENFYHLHVIQITCLFFYFLCIIIGIDEPTRLRLYKLINNQILEQVNGIISTGKGKIGYQLP